MKISKNKTPANEDFTENEAMMMDTKGFNNFLAQTEEAQNK